MPGPRRGHSSRGGRSYRRSNFAQSRIRDEEDNPEVPQVANGDLDEEEEQYPSDSESEPEQITEIRPYNALLQAFNIHQDQSELRRKRRKTNHSNGNLLANRSQTTTRNETKDEDEYSEMDDAEAEKTNVEPSDDDEDNHDSDDDTRQGNFFQQHFENPDTKDLEGRISKATKQGWTNQKQPIWNAWKAVAYTPKDSAFEKPQSQGDANFLRSSLKTRLIDTSIKAHDSLGILEKGLMPYMFSYYDILLGGRTVKNAENLRNLASIHALNHILKTRGRVIKHNALLSAQDGDDTTSYRDQGFTRPKVLFLLPTRNSCAKIVDALVNMYRPEQQENRKRFDENFHSGDQVPEERPEDFRELFEGNDDDMFRLGIKFTRKTIKFFAQFYSSDIILGSPLGLRRAIESGK
jgi:U3 small nucleolar RNA-associated protein 25